MKQIEQIGRKRIKNESIFVKMAHHRGFDLHSG